MTIKTKAKRAGVAMSTGALCVSAGLNTIVGGLMNIVTAPWWGTAIIIAASVVLTAIGGERCRHASEILLGDRS